jgi:hypothetical protein
MARPKGSKNKTKNIAKATRDHEIQMKCLDILQNDPQWKWLIIMFGSAIMSKALAAAASGDKDVAKDTNWAQIMLKILSPGYALTPDWATAVSPLKMMMDSISSSDTDSPWSLITTAAKTADNAQAFSAFMLVIMAMFGGEKGGIGSLMGAFKP